MKQTEQSMLCGWQESSPCEPGSVCTVLFEASTLPALARHVSDWIATHSGYSVISFSHACETRLEPGANLAGPRSRTVYTGFLLLHVVSPT
jgi:hypothetical protein